LQFESTIEDAENLASITAELIGLEKQRSDLQRGLLLRANGLNREAQKAVDLEQKRIEGALVQFEKDEELLDVRRDAAKERMIDIESTRSELAAKETADINLRESRLIAVEVARRDRLLENDVLLAEEREILEQEHQDRVTEIQKGADENRVELAKQVATDKEAIETAVLGSLQVLATAGANQSKELAIFNTLLNTGVAIVASAKLGFPAAIPGILAATVLGATQLNALKNTPAPKFGSGGKIGGSLHSAGGTLIEAERGEVIINRKSMANPHLRAMASRINQAGGGIGFAQAGMLVGQSSINAKLGSLGSEFDSSLRNNRAILVTEDLNIVQSRVAVSEDISTL